jgi:hypothetical protein
MTSSDDLTPQERLRLTRSGFAFTPGGTFVTREEIAAGDAARKATSGARRPDEAEDQRVREQLIASGRYTL